MTFGHHPIDFIHTVPVTRNLHSPPFTHTCDAASHQSDSFSSSPFRDTPPCSSSVLAFVTCSLSMVDTSSDQCGDADKTRHGTANSVSSSSILQNDQHRKRGDRDPSESWLSFHQPSTSHITSCLVSYLGASEQTSQVIRGTLKEVLIGQV